MRPNGGWVSGYRSPSGASPYSRAAGRGVWAMREWAGTQPLPIRLGASLWLDASFASSLWDATSGGSQTASGGTVRRWEDLSGLANHVTGSTGPTRSVASVNGLDSLAFSTQQLTRSALTISQASAASLFAVIKFATSENQIACGFGTTLSYAAMTIEANVRSSGLHSAAFGSNQTASENYATGGSVTNTTRVYGAVFGSGTGTLYISGSSAATVSRASTLNGASGFSVGGYFGLSGYYLSGNVCELVYMTRALSSSEISQLYDYMKNKWRTP